jgi:hypothetical protein
MLMLDVSAFCPPHFSISPSRHRPDPDFSLQLFPSDRFQHFSISAFQLFSVPPPTARTVPVPISGLTRFRFSAC